MIQDKLNDKIEDVTVAALESEVLNTNDAIDPVVDTAMAAPAGLEPSADDIPIIPTPSEEDIQVAGIGSVAKKVLTAVKDKTAEAEKRVTMEAAQPAPIREVDDSILVTPADPDEIKLINQQLGGEYTKGLNFPEILEATGDFDAAQYMEKFKDANQEFFEQARRGTITFDQMLEMAQERGLDQIVFDLMKRKPGEVLPPEDFLAGMLAYGQIVNKTRDGLNEAFQMAPGPERDAAIMRNMAMVNVQSQLVYQLSGTTSESARNLQLAGQLKKSGIPEVQKELTLFNLDNPSTQDLEYAGRMYLSITDPSQMARFVKESKGATTLDKIQEVWINSILTAPPTHMVNIAGNATYQMMNVLETFVASGIGKLRSTVTNNQDRVRAVEGIAQLEGIRHSLFDAILLAGKVAITETPTDLSSKLDVRTRRAIGTTGDIRKLKVTKENGDTDLWNTAVNVFGVYARLGGRALLVEDEFFKAIGGRSELYRIAEIRAADMYEQTIKTGGSTADASQAAARARFEVISNPSEEVKSQVQLKARELTFQEDLKGLSGNLQGAVNHPLSKLFIPFYKTIMNVFGSTLERTPAALAMPKTWGAIKAGGREADTAMAKIAAGSAIMASFAYLAYGDDTESNGIIITGTGPSNKLAKDAMLRQGFQPYSINIKQEDGSYKSITYSRFDPVSGLLAMAADFAYYSQYETDEDTLVEMASAMSLGLAEYMGTMPMLDIAKDIQLIANQPSGDKAAKFIEILTERSTGAVLSVLPTVSSFTAGIERMEDPTLTANQPPAGQDPITGTDYTDLPAYARGFYQALEKAKSRNPFFNDDLPPKLNEWGEEIKAGDGSAWDFWSPVRVQDARFKAVDAELMSLGDGISRTPSKIPGSGVRLNAEQRNFWIKSTNEMDAEGRMPYMPGYDYSTSLLPMLERQIVSPEYQNAPNYKKLEIIKNAVSERRATARDNYLFTTFPELKQKVDTAESEKKDIKQKLIGG